MTVGLDVRMGRTVAALAVSSLTLLAVAAGGCGGSSAASPCDPGDWYGSHPPPAHRLQAERAALRMRSSVGFSGGGADEGGLLLRRRSSTGTVRRYRGEVHLPAWPKQDVVDQVWPYLLLDNTGTAKRELQRLIDL
jgi:hypothetical protein